MKENVSLTEEQEIELYARLKNRVIEGTCYLGDPEEIDAAATLNILATSDLFATANHTARVNLDTIAISDFLGIGVGSDYKFFGRTLAIAALNHDLGKVYYDLAKISEKKSGFSESDREKMKDHVPISAIFLEGSVKAVIVDHHRWQSYSYTPYPPLKNFVNKLLRRDHIIRTPETIVLSKLLGIIDFHDSAATRANTRNSAEPRLLNDDELKELFLREYGNLPIVYHGKKMPRLNMSGQEFIQELYKKGIFGRKNRFNPYEEPYSFIIR